MTPPVPRLFSASSGRESSKKSQFDTRAPSVERAALHDLRGKKGAGILVICASTKRILLGKRGRDCANPETWAPFGGMVEDGETELEGAVRENYEEAGLQISMQDPALIRDVLYVNKAPASGFEFHTFAYLSDFEPEIRINNESSGFAWWALRHLRGAYLHPGFRELILSQSMRGIRQLLGEE